MRSHGKRVYHGESILKYFGTKPVSDSKSKSERIQSCPSISVDPDVRKDHCSLTALPPKQPKLLSDRQELSNCNGYSIETKSVKTKSSKCPGYKWIADTPFTVDAFRYGEIAGCQAYFLSHFHYDHYGGLTKNFRGPIYCSQVTYGFLKQTYGSKLNITALKLNQTHVVCGIEVTAIDANHCPGSVMFLFHVPARKHFVLHTGDFRFSYDMLAHPSPLAQFLTSSSVQLAVHCIYLDTTYCAPQYDFIPQQNVIESAVQVTRDFLRTHKSALILCGMYSIGKERFVYGLAKELNLTVWLPKPQHKLIQVAAQNGCAVCRALLDRTTLVRRDAQLHVVPMKQINIGQLMQYRALPAMASSSPPQALVQTKQSIERMRTVLAWRPTGWSHVPGNQKTVDSKNFSPAANPGVRLERSNGHVYIYGAAYSEHSSFCELRDFVTALRPKRVQPTVFGKDSRTHHSLIDRWHKSTNN